MYNMRAKFHAQFYQKVHNSVIFYEHAPLLQSLKIISLRLTNIINFSSLTSSLSCSIPASKLSAVIAVADADIL